MTTATDDLIGYGAIAEILGYAHESNVRKLASSDTDFPARVTPPAARPPLFRVSDVTEYAERRRGIRKVGRPPARATGITATDLFSSSEDRAAFGDRVRSALRTGTGTGTIRTTIALADALEISAAALRYRLRGSVRWTDDQLEVVAHLMGVSPAA